MDGRREFEIHFFTESEAYCKGSYGESMVSQEVVGIELRYQYLMWAWATHGSARELLESLTLTWLSAVA